MSKITKTTVLTAISAALIVAPLASSVFLATFCETPALAAAAQANKPSAKAKETSDSREDDVRQVIMDLEKAVNEGNGENGAALWGADATLIDASGGVTQGLAALKERLSQNAGKKDTPLLGLHPEKMTFPAPTVAIVVGSASRKVGDTLLPAARFSIVLAKENNKWLIQEATEIATQETRASDHLGEFSWLIGNWEGENKGSGVKLEVEWAGPGHNFILSKSIRNDGKEQQVNRQIIGWDARKQCFVSWHFDCNGGFGYGNWNKKSDGWQVDFVGTSAGGNTTRATNVFTIKSPDEFTWQSMQKDAGGEPISESEPVKVKRTK